MSSQDDRVQAPGAKPFQFLRVHDMANAMSRSNYFHRKLYHS
jgi:hypothetical protein